MSSLRWVTAHGKRFQVETIYPSGTTKRAHKRRPFKARFVQVPDYWMRQLERYGSAAMYQLALRILREDHKRRRQQLGKGEIILSTEVTGLGRETRSWAIKRMVEAKMIKVSQDGNQAARVVELLHMYQTTAKD
jgi:hypothetical protein